MGSEVIKVGQLEIRYLVDGTRGQGLGVFELTVPPGANVPPPHSHTHNEEFVYGLEGSLRYAVDGVSRELGPGDIWFVPSNVVHGVEYVGDVQALEIVSPIRLDNFTGYVAKHTFFDEAQK